MDRALEVLTADDIAFLTDLANELKVQNSYGTRKPIVIQVRKIERTFGSSTYRTDGTVLLAGEELTEIYTVADAKDFLQDYDVEPDDLETLTDLDEFQRICEEQDISCVPVGYEDRDVFSECFLTHKGYEEHMRLNGHNYSHFRHPPSAYVQAVYRNPELVRLLAIVDKFANVLEGSE